MICMDDLCITYQIGNLGCYMWAAARRGAMVGNMPNITWLEGSFVETIKGWQSGWFYITERRNTNWVAALRVSIRNPHAAHFLKGEGPVLGFIGGAGRTP